MAEKLIAYYSRNGENYVKGSLVNLDTGNTEIAANYIKKLLPDADIFKIEQENEYSASYKKCIEEAKADLNSGVRPQLKHYLDSVAGYKTIYLLYPVYWEIMPMAVITFLEHYNFENKIFKPLATHEGSGMGKSESRLKEICPTAIVNRGLPIIGSDVKNSKTIIENWIKQ